MSNQHISEFLDYYTNLSNPQYAVLLKGKWGSGKTHFINKYRKELDTKKQKYIYVSLYGVTSYDEIETKFLETIHPFLYNKKTIFAGKIAKQLLKATFKIDLDGDKKDDDSVSLKTPDFKLDDLFNTKDYILIFDDLERCSIDIINLLGYINYFVEQQSYKVILIANEEELIKNEKELEKTKKYTLIKEKLIGKTFEFISDASSAYDSFLNDELKNTEVKANILVKEKSNILELFEKSESKNLRALRQTLLDFERFYNEVLIHHLLKEELIKDMLYWFFLFSFEMRQGNNEIFKLDEIREEHILSLSNSNDNKEKTKFEIYNDKYSFDHFEQILSFKNWEKILLNSNIEKEEIDSALKNSKYYATEETNSWKLLYSYYDLDDDTFEKLTDEICLKIHNNEYKIFEEVKIISSILLALKEKNLIEKESFCLEYEIKKQIDYLFNNNLIDDETISPKKDIYFQLTKSNEYSGYRYKESKSFQSINIYIKEKIVKKFEEKLENDSQLIINAISKNDITSMYSIFIHSDGIDSPYRDKPILKYINVDILVDILMNCNNETIRNFTNILEKRYDYAISELISEEEFLIKLKEKLEIIKNERVGKLSGYYFDIFCNTLDKCIQKLKEIRK
jgi:hypothetical protein